MSLHRTSVDHQFLRDLCCSNVVHIIHFVIRTALIAEHLINLTVMPARRYRDQCRNLVVYFVNSILQFVPIPIRQSNSNTWWLQHRHRIFIPTSNVHIRIHTVDRNMPRTTDVFTIFRRFTNWWELNMSVDIGKQTKRFQRDAVKNAHFVETKSLINTSLSSWTCRWRFPPKSIARTIFDSAIILLLTDWLTVYR